MSAGSVASSASRQSDQHVQANAAPHQEAVAQLQKQDHRVRPMLVIDGARIKLIVFKQSPSGRDRDGRAHGLLGRCSLLAQASTRLGRQRGSRVRHLNQSELIRAAGEALRQGKLRPASVYEAAGSCRSYQQAQGRTEVDADVPPSCSPGGIA